MKLGDGAGVAEGIAPPAGDEVETLAGHVLEKFPAAIGSAGELSGFVGGSGGRCGCVLLGGGRHLRDCAEVGS